MSLESHRLELRTPQPLPRGLALTDDLVRIVVIAGDLVNTYDPVTGRDWLSDAATLDYVVSDHPWPLPAATPADLAPTADLRGRLSQVFRAAAYDVLAGLLAEHPPLLTLEVAPEGAHRLRVATTAPELPAVLSAQMSLALSVFLSDPTAGSLDVCDGPGCRNVAVRRGDDSFCSDRCRLRAAPVVEPPGRPARGRSAPRSPRPPRR